MSLFQSDKRLTLPDVTNDTDQLVVEVSASGRNIIVSTRDDKQTGPSVLLNTESVELLSRQLLAWLHTPRPPRPGSV